MRAIECNTKRSGKKHMETNLILKVLTLVLNLSYSRTKGGKEKNMLVSYFLSVQT
jgi:hypothetical protein